MPFVVPGVCRFTINARIFERACANIFDMRIDTTGSIVSREDAIETQAGDLLVNWSEHIRPLVHQGYVMNTVSWVDLDEADGTTGERSAAGLFVWPLGGAVTSDRTAANLAVLVTKNTVSARGIRKGRSYLSGIPETQTDGVAGNRLTTTALTSWTTAMDTFKADCESDDSDPNAFESRFCVVHILTRGPDGPNGRPGPPLTGNSNDVSSFSVQTVLATQRRRLRG